MKHIDTLRVSKETKPAAFAGAIYNMFAMDDTLKVKSRAMGKEASHNMFKGIEKAQIYLDAVGLKLYSRFSITYERLPGNEEDVTIYTMELMVLPK